MPFGGLGALGLGNMQMPDSIGIDFNGGRERTENKKEIKHTNSGRTRKAKKKNLTANFPLLYSNTGLLYNHLPTFPTTTFNSYLASYGQPESTMNGVSLMKGSSLSLDDMNEKGSNPILNPTNMSAFHRNTHSKHPPESHTSNDSDDESMNSLMDNHTDDLPEEDLPNENAERIILKGEIWNNILGRI